MKFIQTNWLIYSQYDKHIMVFKYLKKKTDFHSALNVRNHDWGEREDVITAMTHLIQFPFAFAVFHRSQIGFSSMEMS